MSEHFDGDNKGPKDAKHYEHIAQQAKEKAESWREYEISDKNQHLIAADIEFAASARKNAEKDRKDIVQPFLDGQKRINGEFKPVIEDINDSEKFMRSLLAKHLAEVERKQREEAARKREEAEKKKREAEALESDPLMGRQAQREAKASSIEADRAERQKPNVSGGGARAIGLRTYYKAEITDPKALVAHYAHRYELIDAAETLANAEIRGAKDKKSVSIPG